MSLVWIWLTKMLQWKHSERCCHDRRSMTNSRDHPQLAMPPWAGPRGSLALTVTPDISDHFPIVHINCSFSVEETVSCLVTRVYNERNKQKFLQANSAVDCNIPNTLNSFNHFHSMSISLRDQWFPKNEIKKKYSNRKQWLSDVQRNSVRNKNKLYHKYKNIPTIRNETSYKLFRNKLNHVLKIDEKKYYREFIISHKDNTRKSWSIIKDMINKHRMPTIQS